MGMKMLKNKVFYKIIYKIFKIDKLNLLKMNIQKKQKNMIQTIFKRQVKIKINILVFKRI